MKLTISNGKIKICNKYFNYFKDTNWVIDCLTGTEVCTKSIYYLGDIFDTNVVETLFRECNDIYIDNQRFYCSADKKTYDSIYYFMENVKLIEC